MPDIPSFSEFASTLPTASLDDLTSRIKNLGFDIASTTQGRHNPGSLHYQGRAADVRIVGKSPQQVSKLMTELSSAGYHVIDERQRLPNEKVWGGPHIHVQFGGGNKVRLQTPPPDFSEFEKQDIPSFSEFTKQKPQQAVKGDYLNQSVDSAKSLDKLARDIEWHFGYGVLQAFPKLPENKQKQIAQLATQYAASDEVKKKNGQLITKSSAWQELNRRRVQLQMPDVLTPEEEQQQGQLQKDAYARKTNPLLQLGPKSRWLVDMLATGGAGLYEAAAGVVKMAPQDPFTYISGKSPVAEALRSGAETVRNVSAEAESLEPTSKASKLIKGIGSGAVEYAPLMAMPELGIEGVLARIGLSAATFGVYSGLQASGRGESAKGVAKETVTGGALGALFGIPLPGKGILRKGLSNLIIMGGGGTVVNLATGKSLSDSATQGLALMLLRSPELLHGVRVRDANGERAATVDDVKGIRTGVAEKAVSPQVEEAVRSGAKKAGVETGAVERAIQPEPTNEQQPRPAVAAPVKADDSQKVPRETSDKFAGQEDVAQSQIAKTTQDAFENQRGAVAVGSLPGVKHGVKALDTAVSLARMGKIRDFMAYTRGAGRTKAVQFANQQETVVKNLLRRSGVKTKGAAADALSFAVEANGNPAELDVMRQKIDTSTNVSNRWKIRALAAIDYAKANYPKMQAAIQQYNAITDAQRQAELANGINSHYRLGYVMHAQELPEGDLGWMQGRGGGGGMLFRHTRTYDTFADSLAAGIDPKSLNALDLLNSRVARGQSRLQEAAWVDGLKNLIFTKTGKSVVQEIPIVDGMEQVPTGYSSEQVGRRTIAVQNGFEGIFDALTESSKVRKRAIGNAAVTAAAGGKKVALALDTYHMVRLSAVWEALKTSAGHVGLPSYHKGLTLLDTSLPELQEMQRRGELSSRTAADLVENKQVLDLGIEHGLNVGKIVDALIEESGIHKLPVVGPFNNWLFKEFQRGAMSEAFLMEYKLRRSKWGKFETESESARSTVKEINTLFGNLGEQGIFKSRTAQDIMRLLFLAPQWRESLIRREIGAVTGTGKTIGALAKGRPLYVPPLARVVGTVAASVFLGNQVINMLTRGHPTWQNQEDGVGAKISAWVPDFMGNQKSGGFFLHPFSIVGEVTLALTKGFETAMHGMADEPTKLGKLKAAGSAGLISTLDYLRSGASIGTRGLFTALERRDFSGRPIPTKDLFSESARESVPLPIPAGPIWHAIPESVKSKIPGREIPDALVGKDPYPGELMGRAMQSFGIKLERAPSGEQRIRGLAAAYNRSHGVKKQGEFYESPYMQLTETKSPEAAKELLKSKTKEQVLKYYEQRVDKPLTGSADREREFLKTLNPEQRGQYFAAKGQRRQDLSEIRKLLASVGK